jgi:hypothetical protein
MSGKKKLPILAHGVATNTLPRILKMLQRNEISMDQKMSKKDFNIEEM